MDTGNQCCVVPPSPQDAVDPTILLTTVNGGKFDCYGQKQITIKIGQKEYHMKAMIAKVRAPILGWDFFTKYRLDLVWGQFGDLFLRDKRAQIKKYLEHRERVHSTYAARGGGVVLQLRTTLYKGGGGVRPLSTYV